MELKKQDKNGIRKASEVPRRYNLGEIRTIVKRIETSSEENKITIDKELSLKSSNPVENKILTNKFNEIEGKLGEKVTDILVDEVEQSKDENNNVNIQTIKEMNITDSQGHVWFSSGLLIQWGKVLIEEESVEVQFPLEFDKIPFIEAIPYSSSSIDFSIDALENAKEGLVIYCQTSNNFGWKAIGYKNPIQENINGEEENNG